MSYYLAAGCVLYKRQVLITFFFFQAEDGIRDRSPSRGLGDVYKRQEYRDKKDMITIEENIRQTLSYVRGRIKEKDLASYDEILFVSKSLGTVSAGWLADALEKEKRVKPGTVRHIFMTPLEQTFPCLLYTSDAADEEDSGDLGGRRINKQKKEKKNE